MKKGDSKDPLEPINNKIAAFNKGRAGDSRWGSHSVDQAPDFFWTIKYNKVKNAKTCNDQERKAGTCKNR